MIARQSLQDNQSAIIRVWLFPKLLSPYWRNSQNLTVFCSAYPQNIFYLLLPFLMFPSCWGQSNPDVLSGGHSQREITLDPWVCTANSPWNHWSVRVEMSTDVPFRRTALLKQYHSWSSKSISIQNRVILSRNIVWGCRVILTSFIQGDSDTFHCIRIYLHCIRIYLDTHSHLSIAMPLSY